MKTQALGVLLVAFVVFGIAQISEARLGFTKEQCDEQYGKPVSDDTDKVGHRRVSYLKNDIKIQVQFFRGSTIVEVIDYRPTSGFLTEEQLTALLGLNSEGGVWFRPVMKVLRLSMGPAEGGEWLEGEEEEQMIVLRSKDDWYSSKGAEAWASKEDGSLRVKASSRVKKQAEEVEAKKTAKTAEAEALKKKARQQLQGL